MTILYLGLGSPVNALAHWFFPKSSLRQAFKFRLKFVLLIGQDSNLIGRKCKRQFEKPFKRFHCLAICKIFITCRVFYNVSISSGAIFYRFGNPAQLKIRNVTFDILINEN